MNHASLPDGFRYAGSMDFMRNRRQIAVIVKLSAALIAIPLLIGLLLRPVAPSWHLMSKRWYMWPGLFAALVVYVPLHEMVHGLAMLVLSRGIKPRYGLKLPYAYAGSSAWFDKGSHAVIALLPIVLFGIGLTVCALMLPPEWFWPVWIVQISNLSGSAGDLYCVWTLHHMKGELLIQDTGVKMRIMKKMSQEKKAL